ncbi:MAG: extracellular solute-binding protein, partial [Clostridiales bacterium]|nr:extracellular solute-binding protein [Clostridiales bacterium]
MRKWLSLAIAIALALGLAAAAEPATYGGTVMLCIDSGEDAYFDDEFRKGFNELYPGITIDLLAVSPLERLEKVMIMLASGNGPDVLVMEQSYYNTLAPTGYMYAMDDLVAA